MHLHLGSHVLRMAAAIGCLGAAGCLTPAVEWPAQLPRHSDVPRELCKVAHPIYRVAPPDVLLIEAVNNIRPAGDNLRAGDEVLIKLATPEPFEPVDPDAHPVEAEFQYQLEAEFKLLNGPFVIQSDGTVDLGPVYGRVSVDGLSLEQAGRAIEAHLRSYTVDEEGNPVGLKAPRVSVTLPDILGKQQITGEHLVRPDGTISLGVYGSVFVSGHTLEETKSAIETHLSSYIHEPEISVDVLAYNSQVIYVITDGGGYGEEIVRLPVTGNETVLDAISQIQGLAEVSSKTIWVSRPYPGFGEVAQVLDVNWREITREGITTTNYQLLPGDRIYIQADHMIKFDNFVAKFTAPFERMMGFTLLGNGVVRSLQNGNNGQNGGFGGGGF